MNNRLSGAQKFHVRWKDGFREPNVVPDPRYPKGVTVDVSDGAMVTCVASLPYPAKRVGLYVIECSACGRRVSCTTAGRPDDPHSIKMACRRTKR